MGLDKPGLAPRQLEAEVVTTVESDRPDAPTGIEQTSVEPKGQTQVADNTAAPVETKQRNVEAQAQEEQPQSQRENERVRKLIEERDAERARANYNEQMMQRMVNAPQQAQPTQNAEEALAKQYRSFDPNLGYPTDAKEFMDYTDRRAEQRAIQATRRENQASRDQQEIGELIQAYPEVATDSTLLGAISAARTEAQKKGLNLSYKQAADQVDRDLRKRFTAQASASVVKEMQEKNLAYVETTKGASANRTGVQTPDPDSMNLSEMEAYLKQTNEWNNRH